MLNKIKKFRWQRARNMNQKAFEKALPELQIQGLQGKWAVVMSGEVVETWTGYDAALKNYYRHGLNNPGLVKKIPGIFERSVVITRLLAGF